MICLKSKEEIAIIRTGAEILGKLHGLLSDEIKPGVSTKYLDDLAEQFINDNHAKGSFKGLNGYQHTLCISIDDEVVHGVPSATRVLEEGEIVSIDCGVYYRGYHSDSAYTYTVEGCDDMTLTLLKTTKRALYLGIDAVRKGGRVGDIGYNIQSCIEEQGYSIVRSLVGHGVGRKLHEDPDVPNFGTRGTGPKLKNGLVIAIEPMINMGRKDVYFDNDGWTVCTRDNSKSAHFEHTVALVDGKVEILTTFDYINKKYDY